MTTCGDLERCQARSISASGSCVGQVLKRLKNVVLQTNMTSETLELEALTDDQLLDEVKRLARRERVATADLLRCLIEVDTRRLYLREGCASLFTYCTQVLRLAEGAAYNRIETARAARRFPILLERIADGSLTLTSARLLAPHLTAESHDTLLEAARHKGKRDIELLIATLHPQPRVRTVLRKVPTAQVVGSVPAATTATSMTAPGDIERPPLLESLPSTEGSTHDVTAAPKSEQGRGVSNPGPRHEAKPVSATDYRLQVTINAETHDKLRRARDLLRHTIPDGDIAAILDRALTLLLADVEKRRCGAATRPPQCFVEGGSTRHIPAAVKREVWQRDEGRCAFISGTRRCTETAFLEFHHVVPYANGGAATVRNIELRCRAHNQYEAMLFFGDGSDGAREEAAGVVRSRARRSHRNERRRPVFITSAGRYDEPLVPEQVARACSLGTEKARTAAGSLN